MKRLKLLMAFTLVAIAQITLNRLAFTMGVLFVEFVALMIVHVECKNYKG